MSKSKTLGRLLGPNTELIKEIHEQAIDQEFVVLKGDGWVGRVEEVIDEQYFGVRDINGNKFKVSCFEMRSLEY